MLRHNIHRNLPEIKVGPDPAGRRYSRLLQNFMNHLHGKLAGGHMINMEIVRNIHKHFVDGINMDIFGRYVFQINLIDVGTVPDIEGHPRHRGNVVKLKFRIFPKLTNIRRLPGELMPVSFKQTLRIDIADFLHHLKKSWPSGYSKRFECRGHSQTDGFFGPARIRNHKIACQRIQPPLHTLHGGIKRFQINAYTGPFFFFLHHPRHGGHSHFPAPPIFSLS